MYEPLPLLFAHLQKQWSAQYDVSAILRSIQLLLCDPNTSSPANPEAAKLFEGDKLEYCRRVKETVERSWEYAASFSGVNTNNNL